MAIAGALTRRRRLDDGSDGGPTQDDNAPDGSTVGTIDSKRPPSASRKSGPRRRICGAAAAAIAIVITSACAATLLFVSLRSPPEAAAGALEEKGGREGRAASVPIFPGDEGTSGGVARWGARVRGRGTAPWNLPPLELEGGGDNGLGQCVDAEMLFPPALPISPCKATEKMAKRRNFSEGVLSRDWEAASRNGLLRDALAWFQLAMPNTGTTSMDGYMALGSNATPLERTNGCRRSCSKRIGRGRTALFSEELMKMWGVDSSELQRCEPETFRMMSSVARCKGSGGHFDYSGLESRSDSCLSRWSGKEGRFITGTTIRDPITYHHKNFHESGFPPAFDVKVCDIWADLHFNQSMAADNPYEPDNSNDTHIFHCKEVKNGWYIGSDFLSYMDFAHHRWNLFTRNLAGTFFPRHSPIMMNEDVKEMHLKYFTRSDAMQQNALGKNDPDYISAVSHLEAMPHFSIFERMTESVELLCFTFCFNCTALGFSYNPKMRPPVPDEVRKVASQFHKLDIMLYEHANSIFEQRVNWMREAKSKGVTCDILLSGCGLSCEA